MNIGAGAPLAGLAVFAKDPLQLSELIGVIGEMRERVIAVGLSAFQLGPHIGAVVAVKGVAFDRNGRNAFAAENLVEGLFHGRGARAGRPRDTDDRVFGAHVDVLKVLGSGAEQPAHTKESRCLLVRQIVVGGDPCHLVGRAEDKGGTHV